MTIQLPISKSIANRVLILQAMHGEDTLSSPAGLLGDTLPDNLLCDDIRLLRDSLQQIKSSIEFRASSIEQDTLFLANCGTAMRFLTAYCAVQPNLDITLTGSERMQQRPIGQLVDALRSVGAEIEYLGEEGFPPLRIKPPSNPPLGGGSVQIDLRGQQLDSTQFVSSLMLVGFDVLTDEDSPYIEMTRELIDNYPLSIINYPLERDWSAASYWYEYVALYGGEVFFPDLHLDSLQGDKAVVEIFEPLGVKTEETDDGLKISRYESSPQGGIRGGLQLDFANCPDLYPAVYMTCYQLGIELQATGIERLQYKESNRLQAFEQLESGQRSQDKGQRTKEPRIMSSYADHRVAMALLVAGYQVDDVACVSKSYPQFVEQLRNVTFVVPCREAPLPSPPKEGNSHAAYVIRVFDEGKGKKWALEQGVRQATTEFVWFTDIDVERACYPIFVPPTLLGDLTILPLCMASSIQRPMSSIQQIEYLAIQSLTMLAAERGRAVMCSGANLIVNREKWLNCLSDLHPEIPSGDDMFLLEAFKRKGYTVQPLYQPEYIATIQPEPTCKAFFHQRMRWAGKAPKYTDRDIITCGAMTVLANLLVLVCLPLALFKFPFDYHIIKQGKRFNLYAQPPKHLFGWSLLLEFVYPFYLLIALVGGLFRQTKW